MTTQVGGQSSTEQDPGAALETEELDPGEIEDSLERGTADEDVVRLRSNKSIPMGDIVAFRNRNRAQTIVLVGEQKTGKTTLLAAIYGMFCKGPVGTLEFVSSQTLYSFAERSHLAMLAPGRKAAATPRTSIGDSVSYFHLKVRNEETTSDVLISDRSGETFEAVRVQTELVDRVTELQLADRVCFLLDAARLTRMETRAGYRRIFKQTINALMDNDAIPRTAVVEILVTKIDRISKSQEGRDLASELAGYEDELKAEFGGRGFAFEIHRVCALPRAAVAIGFVGMEELIARWTAGPSEADIAPQPVAGALRYIDRLPELWS